jgi:phospholipase A1
MRLIYLIPGIMGSRLALNGEEIWPPTLRELTVSHYGRIAQLSDPTAESTDVIRQVTDCYQVYGSLLTELDHWGYREKDTVGSRGKVVAWHYDWRKDNRNSAALLSGDLGRAAKEPETEIVLIAHSMGGLIARYALETADSSLCDTSWRKQCSLLVTMGTPHRGAPLALVRALGAESAMGMRANDIKAFAADPRFPAAYQLLPPPDAFAFWSAALTPSPLAGIDIADHHWSELLSLNKANLLAAKEQYQALDQGTRPPQCRYFNFIGRRAETIVRGVLDSAGTLDAPKIRDGGDGTVPIWSGTLPSTQFQLDGDEHARTFRDKQLLTTLASLLGVPAGLVRGPESDYPLKLTLPQPIFPASAKVNFRIDSTLPQGTQLELYIEEIGDDGVTRAPPMLLAAIATTAPSDTFAVTVTLPPQEGLYQAFVRFTNARESSDPQTFAIQVNA